MKLRLAVLAAALAPTLCAGDFNFNRFVRDVEHQLGIRRTYIPFLGIANFFVRVARPEGVRSVHVAIFEDQKINLAAHGDKLDRLIGDAAQGLRPLVVARSKRGGERTYVFAGGSTKTPTVLVATFERDDATLVEARVSIDALIRSMEHPGLAGRLVLSNR